MAITDDFAAELEARGVSEARERDHLRLLRQLDAFLATKPLLCADGSDLAAYLAHRREAGIAAGSLRKERQLALAFFAWASETGQIGAETLNSMRTAVSLQGSACKVDPKPYTAKEIRQLGELLDSRWSRLDDGEAEKRVKRWKKGTGTYARVREHSMRLQLDAVIALALHCGLRRGEISALHVDDAHPDNAHIVVWRGERLNSPHREVPFTDNSREAVAAWLDFRAGMGVEHEHPWLNLWSEKTAREPLKAETFAKLLTGHVGSKWTFGRLRHTCAVEWLRAGMTPVEVQQLLGHAALKDVGPYLEAIKAPLERRVQRLQGPFAKAVALA